MATAIKLLGNGQVGIGKTIRFSEIVILKKFASFAQSCGSAFIVDVKD
jgi:hypothetical protein